MTHSICSSEAGGQISYFQRLWRSLLAPKVDPETRIERLLDRESDEFGLECAFLSQIDQEAETERFEVVHGAHELLKPRTTVPLGKSYCRKTIADPTGTLAVSDAVAEGWANDPAYETFGFDSYLGTTVSVADEPYGTLCFADTDARADPIRDEEKALLEMHAQWVEYTAALRGRVPTQGTRVDAVKGRTVSTEAIDTMMGALKRRSSRIVLMTLLGDTTEVDIDTLERRIDHGQIRVQLYHRELPKLADAGYIEWDQETNVVSRGPNFAEVEPLVQLLKEYNTPYPE